MQISALVRNAFGTHEVTVATAGTAQRFAVSCKPDGFGSAVNGGEFLMLALATCYCNDLYREAARMQLPIESVQVEARADFEVVGLAASNITYRARVVSPASQTEIEALLERTDAVAEVQNTLRAGRSVARRTWVHEDPGDAAPADRL